MTIDFRFIELGEIFNPWLNEPTGDDDMRGSPEEFGLKPDAPQSAKDAFAQYLNIKAEYKAQGRIC